MTLLFLLLTDNNCQRNNNNNNNKRWDYVDIKYLICPRIQRKGCRHNGICTLFLIPSPRDGYVGGEKTRGARLGLHIDEND